MKQKIKIYYCIEPDCNSIVSGKNRRCRKCSGKLHSQRMESKNNSNYKHGLTNKKGICIDCDNETSSIKYERCICLESAGMLNFTQKGKPISDCQVCKGTGKMKQGVK